MLKLRTDTRYVAQDGKLTQAGFEALQRPIDAVDTRLTAVETELAGSLINLQSAVAAASQTSIDRTGIPSWANRVTITFDDLSTNGTSPVQIQLGDSGGVETTGYRGSFTSFNASALTTTNAGAGAQVETGSLPVATAQRNGTVTVIRVSGNTWSICGMVGQAQATGNTFIAVNKTLSAALDRVRVTTVNGTDTFDAGSVGFSWE